MTPTSCKAFLVMIGLGVGKLREVCAEMGRSTGAREGTLSDEGLRLLSPYIRRLCSFLFIYSLTHILFSSDLSSMNDILELFLDALLLPRFSSRYLLTQFLSYSTRRCSEMRDKLQVSIADIYK